MTTAAKRYSAIFPLRTWGRVVLPDGTIDQGDRQALAGVYSGILAAEPVVPEEPAAEVREAVLAGGFRGPRIAIPGFEVDIPQYVRGVARIESPGQELIAFGYTGPHDVVGTGRAVDTPEMCTMGTLVVEEIVLCRAAMIGPRPRVRAAGDVVDDEAEAIAAILAALVA